MRRDQLGRPERQARSARNAASVCRGLRPAERVARRRVGPGDQRRAVVAHATTDPASPVRGELGDRPESAWRACRDRRPDGVASASVERPARVRPRQAAVAVRRPSRARRRPGTRAIGLAGVDDAASAEARPRGGADRRADDPTASAPPRRRPALAQATTARPFATRPPRRVARVLPACARATCGRPKRAAATARVPRRCIGRRSVRTADRVGHHKVAAARRSASATL